jgi:UDP-glucose 4-epimerase
VIHGDGSQAYDFVHVHDVARANLLAMAADVTDAAYNVCTGTRTTISELVEGLLTLTDAELEPEFVPDERIFVTERVGCPEAAARDLGFRAGIRLDEGLRTVVESLRTPH